MTDSDLEQQVGKAGEVLKLDARGRVRTTAKQREMMLGEFERSGLSGPALSESLCFGCFVMLVVGVMFFHPQHAEDEKNRDPNWIANWFTAAVQFSGGLVHLAVMLRKAKYINLVAASSLGKCPRFFMILRNCMFKLSIAFVV